jgi:hypothetical protein
MCWSSLPAPVQPEVLFRVLADKTFQNLDMPLGERLHCIIVIYFNFLV